MIHNVKVKHLQVHIEAYYYYSRDIMSISANRNRAGK